jgi:hypothetical protein
VLKPAVGAGSVDAALFDMAAHEADLAHARLLAARQTVMVQPYPNRSRHGEAALIFVGGSSATQSQGAMLADRGLVSGLYKAERSRAPPAPLNCKWPAPPWLRPPVALTASCTRASISCRAPAVRRWSSNWS